MSLILFWFRTILRYQTFKVRHSEWISIMSKNKLIIVNLESDFALSELIRNIFSILNKFPAPSNPSIFVFVEVVDVLRQLLSKSDVSGCVFGFLILSVGKIVNILALHN